LRIIAGRLRGRRLAVPKSAGPDLRPTSDRVREALFSIVGNLTGASVLDLYSGTGAIAFESWSRGASRVVAVEADAGLARTIRSERVRFGIPATELDVLSKPVEDAVRSLGPTPFDLVYADPPWELGIAPALVEEIARRLVAPTGMLVVELDLEREAPEVEGELRRYGRTGLLIRRPDGGDC